MYNQSTITIAKTLINHLQHNNIYGNIQMSYLNITINIHSPSSMGGLLQEWFHSWLQQNNFQPRVLANSQEFPDFFIGNTMLELKTFNYMGSPNFDVANFDKLVRSCIMDPQNLFADYIIFGYTVTPQGFLINKVWIKKIWELCGNSRECPLRIQRKQNIIYNIRPINIENNPGFANLEDFLMAIQSTINLFGQYNSSLGIKEEWLLKVKNSLHSKGYEL